MLTAPTAASIIVAYHDTQSGGAGGTIVLVAFLGAVATAGWLMFSRLSWRNTVMLAVAGWLVGLGVTFAM